LNDKQRPIILPCDDSISRQHLPERYVLKENKIKCKTCNREFVVKYNHFESDEALSQLIESKFFEFYDEFNQNRTKLNWDVFNHYHEIRFQIDEHRERD
jgi:hypothetical protein